MRIGATSIKLIVFFAVTGLTAVYLAVLLDETRSGGREVAVNAVFDDVSYLQPDDEVRIAGVRVGEVTDVRMRQDATVLVRMSISGAPQLTAATRATIKYKNLVGDRYLELSTGPGDPSALPPGGTIPTSRTTPALDLDALVGGFQPLFQALSPDQINQLSTSLIQVLQGQSGALGSFLASVSSVTNSLADRGEVIGRVIDNLNRTLGTFDQHDEQLGAVIERTRSLVSGLAEQRHPMAQAVTNLNDLTGVAADLLPRLRPDLSATVRRLDTVSTTLNEHKQEVDAALRTLPDAYRAVSRIGIHGSFFNAYLCSLRFKVVDGNGTPVFTPWLHSSQQRCRPEGGN